MRPCDQAPFVPFVVRYVVQQIARMEFDYYSVIKSAASFISTFFISAKQSEPRCSALTNLVNPVYIDATVLAHEIYRM